MQVKNQHLLAIAGFLAIGCLASTAKSTPSIPGMDSGGASSMILDAQHNRLYVLQGSNVYQLWTESTLSSAIPDRPWKTLAP